MKRLLALLLTAGLTIGLTGCGPELDKGIVCLRKGNNSHE